MGPPWNGCAGAVKRGGANRRSAPARDHEMGEDFARIEEHAIEQLAAELDHDVEDPHGQLGEDARRPAVDAGEPGDRAEPDAGPEAPDGHELDRRKPRALEE